MIEVKVNKGNVSLTVEGFRLDLMAEMPIAFGKVLYRILGDCPEGLKNELIKTTFELTLESMKEEEEKQ